ncbi:hypothetical protein PHET_04122 [Paragonimus heterotremus]|uniref:Uncharacterized protein n=1 Tax=Paragonimus heterotremus TaxID=100268 RepID=A0A8J4WHA6_9TREM|nr:hypothetical protein PHET_04122 [Paragonimus heterotremus]
MTSYCFILCMILLAGSAQDLADLDLNTIDEFYDAIGACSNRAMALGLGRLDCKECVQILYDRCNSFCYVDHVCSEKCRKARTYGRFSCKANLN